MAYDKGQKSTQQEKIRTVISSGTEKTKDLLAAKKPHRKHFCGQYYEMKCSSEFYKYVKRQKGNRQIIPAIKD